MYKYYFDRFIQSVRDGKYKTLAYKFKMVIFQCFIDVWFHITLRTKNLEWEREGVNWRDYTYLKAKYNSLLTQRAQYVKREALCSKSQALNSFNDVIWWCWLQGEEQAPDICRVCLKSLRRQMPNKEIIIITRENYKQYVEFPDYIIDKFEKGIISNTHFSDLLRLQLLINWGGTWIDSTVYCTGEEKHIGTGNLFVYKNTNRNDATKASNWFISSGKNDGILVLTRDLLFNYWKDYNFLVNYYIFHFFFAMSTEIYKEEWEQIPTYTNDSPHQMQREILCQYSDERFMELAEISNLHKLTYKELGKKDLAGTMLKHILDNQN